MEVIAFVLLGVQLTCLFALIITKNFYFGIGVIGLMSIIISILIGYQWIK